MEPSEVSLIRVWVSGGGSHRAFLGRERPWPGFEPEHFARRTEITDCQPTGARAAMP